MKYPYLKTTFNSDLDERTIEIINKYWDFEDDTFVYTPTDLREQFNLTQYELNSTVKDNSKTKLLIDKCIECKEEIEINVTSQSTVKSKIEKNNFQCSKCKENFKISLNEVDFNEINNYRLQYALKHQLWVKLKREELAVFNTVIKYENYSDLYRNFIAHDFEYIWPILEKLNRLGLIEIRRNNDNENRIETIYFLPEIREVFNVEVRDFYETESDLNFNIPINHKRTKETQPHFSKKIIFDKNITIEPGIKYMCSVWKNSDGSINLGLSPISELVNKTDEQDISDPKSIRDIISIMKK